LEEIDASYEINFFYDSFVFTSADITTEPMQSAKRFLLPSMARATTLCQNLRKHLAWMFSIVSIQYLIGELIPAFYTPDRVHPRTYGPHDLALLLISFGIGALVDLNLPPYHEEAQYYYRLALSAVNLQSIQTSPSIVTIKCLHLMSIYNGLSGKESGLEDSFSLLNLAWKVALKV
jgi:hypothetical protein